MHFPTRTDDSFGNHSIYQVEILCKVEPGLAKKNSLKTFYKLWTCEVDIYTDLSLL